MTEASTTSADAALRPRLEMRGVCKRFGPTVALDDVDLLVAPGEVHAIIGENGAGKSTLMKILAGSVKSDAGTMRIDGRTFAPGNPLAARAAGVAMIHQDLCLAPHLSVEANLTLGIESHAGGVLRRTANARRAREVLARLERPDISPQSIVRGLSPAARQVAEIARALMTEPPSRIIVMDEPTSSLGLADVERLFAVIANLKSQGASVIYISHFLEEVARVADRFTVLRDGKVAATGAMRDVTMSQLVESMIGRKLAAMYPSVPHAIGDLRIEMRGIEGMRLPRGASVALGRGEILGVAGLVGAGRTEMLRSVFGLDTMPRGEVQVMGRTPRGGSPAARLRQGIGMLSEDRTAEGLAPNMPIAHNLTLGALSGIARFGWINRRREREAVARQASSLGVRMRDAAQRAGELSGGNQQKIALARLMYRDCDVLLLDEPTRGIDVASRAQIYQLIGELAAAGKSIIFVSSAIPELLGVCDRVVVMRRGKIVADRPARQWTEHEVIRAAITGREQSDVAA